MAMSRKDYEAIASIISQQYQINKERLGYDPILKHGADAATSSIGNHLATHLKKDTPAFDNCRFIGACAKKYMK